MKFIGLVSLAVILVGAFQNCGLTFNTRAGFGLAKANGNGTGYDGKAYASYGRCDAQEEIGLKSLVLQNEDGSFEQVRKDCTDLTEPISLDESKVSMPMADDSVLVYRDSVYDEVRTSLEVARLTRVICWGDYSPDDKTLKTESAVFYGPGSFGPGAKPIMSGYVMNTKGDDTGIMSPVTETITKSNGALFQCKQSDYVFAIDYRTSGNSTMSYYDTKTTDTSSAKRLPSKVGCFSQPMPKSVLTRGDL